MDVTTTDIPGVVILEPRVFGDARGGLWEAYRHERFEAAGLTNGFVQDNVSLSRQGVVRGLHYQLEHPQGKLVSVVQGRIYDVAVDIRRGSPTFGRWVSTILSAEKPRQILIPEGFAHGFCTLSTQATVIYKCTRPYRPGDQCGIAFDDPSLGIDWPVESPILSDRDKTWEPLHEHREDLPSYHPASS